MVDSAVPTAREARTRHLWVDRLIFAYKFRVLRQRRIALASYQRSGNTWMRKLLESATGSETGTIYERDMTAGAIDRGLVVKTHALDSHRYTGAIHLVRNPFDCIESLYQWRRQCGRGGGGEWDDLVRRAAPKWNAHARHWLNVRYGVLRLRYEDLHADPAAQLTAALRWLGCDVPDERVRQAVEECGLARLRAKSGAMGPRFFRRGEVGAGLTSFSRAQREYVVGCAGDVMKTLGYSVPAEGSNGG